MSSPHLRSILLIGVTGSLSFGQFVVNALERQLEQFDRIAVYHDLSRPTTDLKRQLLDRWSAAGIQIISRHGYETYEQFVGFDTVMIFLGNHALHLQRNIIDLAIYAGVRHIYPSEYGADLLVGDNWTMRYYKYKVQTRRHLESRGQELPQLGWTYILFGRLAEWSVLPHFGFDNKNAAARIYGSASGRQSLIAVSDAAAYVVATLRLAPGIENHRRTFRVSTSSPTYGEIFDIVKRVTGNMYDVTYLDVHAAKEEERKAKTKGDVDAELAASHKLVQGMEGTLLPQPWDNDVFPGVELTSIQESLAVAFRSDMFRAAYGLPPIVQSS